MGNEERDGRDARDEPRDARDADGEEFAGEAEFGVNAEHTEFPCGSCGADLVYAPGTDRVICRWCGHHNVIAGADAAIVEHDFEAALANQADAKVTDVHDTIQCGSCGAVLDRLPKDTAFACPYCASHIVLEKESRRLLRAESLLPFKITAAESRERFSQWLSGLWFAPGDLSQFSRRESGLEGVYLPHWTFDAETSSDYTGRRGDDYWVTVTHMVMVNGKMTPQTQQVRKTRWSRASGNVEVAFDDVLVNASRSLPGDKVRELEPWPLHELAPFDAKYLAGFRSENYQVELPEGFEIGRGIMDVGIRAAIRRDIGGDHQRIATVDTRHSDVTFKLVLLPIWVSAFRYRDKVYRFMVNARTGEVLGDRPYSAWKITLAILLGVAVVGGLIAFFATR